jgi:hypothetical protein
MNQPGKAMPPDPFIQYLRAIRTNLAAGDATEHTHRPALKSLLEALRTGVQAINEPKHRTDCGAPDIRVRRKGLTLGYIECKDIGISLDDAERSDQVQRYLKHLPNVILTDYLEFRWYVDGKLRQEARSAYPVPGGKLTPDKAGTDAVRELLQAFLQHEPEEISKPKELAERMAPLTHAIRDMIVQAFQRGDASTMLAGLHDAFQRTLIPDLPVAEFADMFAQTLAYGLFAARCNHPGPEPFKRLGAAAEIPKTNPFLRQLFETITGVDLDDEPFVGFVDDLVDLLAYSDIGAILRDFGKRTRKEDPVVHFYETFLAQYDPRLRKVRGVYFTPIPVVSYIVRSVDYLLRTRFGCPDGLADEAKITYEREERRGDEMVKLQDSAPRVLILDPACGTGTFLYSIVDHIRSEFQERGDAGMWSGYVREHLLPRLFGFELLMAPYAVAHLKLGMQLAAQDMPDSVRAQWAYDFSGHERLGIYLTNTLEQAERQAETLFGPLRAITEEANAAARIKRDLPIMVVLGNPPYAGHSANRSWEVKEGKRIPTFIGRLVQEYYQVDGQPLGERNPKWLQDDYVKFIRFAQWRIEQTGAGILAFITNHGYLDNPTFRGMRQQLARAFTDIFILDLHGSTKKKERCPDGSEDENVFDIQQGVAIGILVRHPGVRARGIVHHADLWGRRETPDTGEGKSAWLSAHSVDTTSWQPLNPQPPLYAFAPQDLSLQGEYHLGSSIASVMPLGRVGPNSHRDHFAVGFDRGQVLDRLRELADRRAATEDLRRKYQIPDTSQWSLVTARDQIAAVPDLNTLVVKCLYRPFDLRYMIYGKAAFDRPRSEVNDHLLYPNLALITTKQTREQFAAFACNIPCGQHKLATPYDGSYVFPLYLYSQGQNRAQASLEDRADGSPAANRQPNVTLEFIADVSQHLGLTLVRDGRGDLRETFGPEDVFHYIYAVLHSPTYRQRYAEFLKTDFPRVPLTSNLNLFRALAEKGADLVALHLMEDGYAAASWQLAGPRGASPFASLITRFPVPGDNLVDKAYPRYFPPGHKMAAEPEPLPAGRVYINAEDSNKGSRAQYFEGVPPEVWDFHVGGYQVCDKWLKDRRGRQLSYDDLTHYQRIVVALKDTIRLMAEIDQAINADGGWPDAFAPKSEPETGRLVP